jgi:hypothetical protein
MTKSFPVIVALYISLDLDTMEIDEQIGHVLASSTEAHKTADDRSQLYVLVLFCWRNIDGPRLWLGGVTPDKYSLQETRKEVKRNLQIFQVT